MAIMAVKIEDCASLRMNEFFDYNGSCYAVSRSRALSCARGAELEDFYECTVLTDWIEGVPVIFLCGKPQLKGPEHEVKLTAPDHKPHLTAADHNPQLKGMGGAPAELVVGPGESPAAELFVCGWYRQAKIYRTVRRPSLFLEGNIEARALDAVLLPMERWIPVGEVFSAPEQMFGEKLYKVIEEDDTCHDRVWDMVSSVKVSGIPVRYDLYTAYIDRQGLNRAGRSASAGGAGRSASAGGAGRSASAGGAGRSAAAGGAGRSASVSGAERKRRAQYEFCIEHCHDYASRLMSDGCDNIGEIRTLREYAQLAVLYGARQADGYYYEAMADEQLGFIREGLKAINRALELEPDGADLLALKANLLTAYGKYEEALALYSESYDISGDESYLMMKGIVYFIIGNVDAAYKTYRQIENKTLLADAGINLKDMERRWPFVAIRGLKNLLKLK